MEFIASYDPETQAGTIYSPEKELEITFLRINTVDWYPLTSFVDGQEKPLPSCFTPDSELLKALDDSIVLGRTVERELV